jgi:hypothetical protein
MIDFDSDPANHVNDVLGTLHEVSMQLEDLRGEPLPPAGTVTDIRERQWASWSVARRAHHGFAVRVTGGDNMRTTYAGSPDKGAARRIWTLIQRDALENGIPQSEWKWQTFADFWQMYAADQESRG